MVNTNADSCHKCVGDYVEMEFTARRLSGTRYADGTMPIFMLTEPVILLAAVISFIVCVVKVRKKKE